MIAYLALAVAAVALLVALYRPYPAAEKLECLLREYIASNKKIDNKLSLNRARDLQKERQQ